VKFCDVTLAPLSATCRLVGEKVSDAPLGVKVYEPFASPESCTRQTHLPLWSGCRPAQCDLRTDPRDWWRDRSRDRIGRRRTATARGSGEVRGRHVGPGQGVLAVCRTEAD
jgi:hypothetical protein